MTTTSSRLAAALAALDEAADCCLAVGQLPSDTAAEVRRAAADTAVTAYEAADVVVEALLGVILAAGGCPGLFDALSAAYDRASGRVGEVYQRKLADGLTRANERAQAVADHALERATGRLAEVGERIILPYWRARVRPS